MKGKSNISFFGLLLIASILGLLARVAVPGIVRGDVEEKTCELAEAVQTMRSALTLYTSQHGGRLPAVDSFELFEMAMTTKVGERGPYIDQIPPNPFNDLNTVRFDGKPAGYSLAGWRFDTKTGSIHADDTIAHAGF
jgi:type II secretory pathway pseudopilin PulG